MARIKATCSECGETILLFFQENDADWKAIRGLDVGEMFEHKCPSCKSWAAFKIVEETEEE